MGKIAVIGCGGTGSYLLPLLLRSIKNSTITLFDGDSFTKENLDRQLFRPDLVGRNKANAMCTMYPTDKMSAVASFLKAPKELEGFDLVFACPDNHVARARVLEAADSYDLAAIICGNEFNSSMALIYRSEWHGTALDPRERYPELLTDKTGSPTETSCTGEAVENSPQLALANNTSAVFAMQLMHFWFNIMTPELQADKEAQPAFPVEFNWAPSKITTITVEKAEADVKFKSDLKKESEEIINDSNTEEKTEPGDIRDTAGSSEPGT